MVNQFFNRLLHKPNCFRHKPVSKLINRFNVEIGSLSNIGRCRTSNQDSLGIVWFANNQNVLALLADGMGGCRGGEVASKMAVELLPQLFLTQLKQKKVLQALCNSFMTTNKIIYQQAQESSELTGMGTTLVALVLVGRYIYYANTGDSRCYLIPNGGQIQQLSKDHTLVADLLERGLLSTDTAENHPEKHIITSAIGTRGELKIAASEHPLSVEAGDVFLLCSDGLYDQLTAAEIQQIVLNNPAQEACHQLVILANERGGYDNISIIVLKIAEQNFSLKPVPITRF